MYGLTACRQCGEIHQIHEVCLMLAEPSPGLWRLLWIATLASMPVYWLAALGLGRVTGWW